MKEALKMAMEALEGVLDDAPKVLEASITGGLYEVIQCRDAITAIKEALAQPEKPKYRRGDRLICLETEEYCVIHISGTDRQWVKFPDSHIGVYTNEQVSELFELLPKEPEQEPVAWHYPGGKPDQCTTDKAYAEKDPAWTPMYYKQEWVGLTDEEVDQFHNWKDCTWSTNELVRYVEQTLKDKNT